MNISIENYQHILFPYAYNVMGTVEDAEDVIQDIIIQFSKIPLDTVNNPKNYLIKSVINRAIRLKQKKNKTILTDVWLPEPVTTDYDDKHRQILNFSLLARLEHLNPRERAVFILKEGFDHSHEEIRDILSSTVENSRKILSRAKEKLRNMNYTTKIKQQPAISDTVKKLINAIQKEDTEEVKLLLTEGIQFYADGGKDIQIVAKECSGNQLVSKLLVYIQHMFNSLSKTTFTVINHQPAVLYIQDDLIKSCQIFEVAEDKVIRIDSVIDPYKLVKLQKSSKAKITR